MNKMRQPLERLTVLERGRKHKSPVLGIRQGASPQFLKPLKRQEMSTRNSCILKIGDLHAMDPLLKNHGPPKLDQGEIHNLKSSICDH